MNEELNFAEELDKDDAWLKSHLEEIVATYARRVIAILDQDIVAVGDSIEEVQQYMIKQYPTRTPFLFEVPGQEEFVCLLSSTPTQ
jgi:peptide subunit release factor RF-3